MVKLRRYHRRGEPTGEWEVDVRVELADGKVFRQRVLYRDSPSKTEARVWGEEREQHVRNLGRQGLDLAGIRRALRGDDDEGPTLENFWPDFIAGYCKANREKHSTIRARESIYKEHFKPWYEVPLSRITDEEVQKLKGRLAARAPKTVNNVLVCLSVMLKTAVAWDRLPEVPCTINLVKVDSQRVPEFYEPEEFERLLAAAHVDGGDAESIVLLGGEAGLRKGEIIALEWDDLDHVRGHIVVRRAEYRSVVGLPKGSKTRVVPMTERLKKALAAFRHLRGARLFYRPDGTTVSEEWVRGVLKRVERRAGLPVTKGKCHKLRHTFCSRLAMANVPMITIQKLAGHESIETTQRYMHLSTAATADGIRTLEHGSRGGAVEAATAASETPSNSAK